LAGNCLPYHQPNCPTTEKPTKVLEPTWFLLTFRGRRFCLHAFLGVLLPTTLVHSQLHQRHLKQTTWFDGAHLRECKQTANIQPSFQSRPMPKSFLGVKVHWQHSLIMEPPLSELFSVVKIDLMHCCSHLQPETPPATPLMLLTGVTLALSRMVMLLRLGTMTALADRKDTVKCCDTLSYFFFAGAVRARSSDGHQSIG